MLVGDWHAVALSGDVGDDTPYPVVLLGREVLLWRHGGRVRAWQDLCRHRGTRLSLGRVQRGRLVCAYHGWAYDGEGRCVHIPAHPDQPPPDKACLLPYSSCEHWGLVWVCLGTPAHELPPVSEGRLIPCGPYEFAAAAPRVVENFLDVGHFPFVHEGILGDPAHPEISDYQVETGPDGITVRDVEVYQPDPDGTGVGARVSYTYRVFRPLQAWFTKGQGFAILLAVTPVSERQSVAFMVLSMSYGHEIPEEELRAFQDRIVAQDRPIVESQRPELLPLDLAAELHLRSDRAALAYRRWLRELGMTFGTA